MYHGIHCNRGREEEREGGRDEGREGVRGKEGGREGEGGKERGRGREGRHHNLTVVYTADGDATRALQRS